MDAEKLMAIPSEPAKGMVFWVQDGEHWAMGDGYTISTVNGRSFYVSSRGETKRHLLAEWDWWLDQRMDEGRVFYRGRQLKRSMETDALTRGVVIPEFKIDLPGRDRRFLRAAREVLKNYTLSRRDDEGGVTTIVVSRGRRRYHVGLHRDWAMPPQCDCPDARNGAARLTAGFCKHTIAVLIEYDDLRCQLLDVML